MGLEKIILRLKSVESQMEKKEGKAGKKKKTQLEEIMIENALSLLRQIH